MNLYLSLAQLQAMSPGPDRIHAISAYIEHSEQTIKNARRLRDADVRALVSDLGPAKAAQKSGLSLATVKSISRGHR